MLQLISSVFHLVGYMAMGISLIGLVQHTVKLKGKVDELESRIESAEDDAFRALLRSANVRDDNTRQQEADAVIRKAVALSEIKKSEWQLQYDLAEKSGIDVKLR